MCLSIWKSRDAVPGFPWIAAGPTSKKTERCLRNALTRKVRLGLKSGVDLKRGTSRLLTLPKRKIRDGPRVLVYPGTRCNQQVCDVTLNSSSQRSSPQAATGLRRLAAVILLGVQRVRSVREGHAKGSRMHGDAMQWLSRSGDFVKNPYEAFPPLPMQH